ncbi:MAG TPA: glycogen debranching N-terminal domain-containing protein [Tepidiformaceae bacterium]|nr:glycogen debranching N-terminal domain-containing protein [Tepidiformaceae bacterium]
MSDSGISPLEQTWLPVGEEPLAPHNITHYAVLRNNGISVLSLPSGEIDATNDESASTGLYHQDTRYLSCLSLSFGGVPPMLLDAREAAGGLTAIFTNSTIRSLVTGEVIPAQTLVLRRKRLIGDGLMESISVSNYGLHPIEVPLRLDFDMDFRDIFEVRGYERMGSRPSVRRTVGADEVNFSCVGADGRERRSRISFLTAPDVLDERSAGFVLKLGPRDTFSVDIEVCVDAPVHRCEVAAVAAAVNDAERQWLAAGTSFECDDDMLNAVVTRALLDIRALSTTAGGDEYIAAGVPWFDTLFGRDSLLTGIEMLAWNPTVLRMGLTVLAKYQAHSVDPVHDATPGKIPHELRSGELARSGELPFGCYYGSVDVTPLFILSAWEYFRWTGDRDTLQQLWPALERAMAWCTDQCDRDPRGFLSYSRVSSMGLENQGWKDSHDAIVWPDGRLVEGPIALIEVQGYLASAFGAFASMLAVLGAGDPQPYIRRGNEFSAAIDRHFGDELGYALCLDGNGNPVPTAASNAGHMLWSGTARADLAGKCADRLFRPDMFSGWGIRTLAASIGRYNPLGYHVGSVWPHDNALLLAGLRGYGFDDLAERLASSLLQMSVSFADLRVPELFSGDARDLRLVPTPYPVASRPQAWSAASVPYILATMLGLRPGRPGQLTITRPILPAGLNWVQLRNLACCDGTVDLTFRRSGSHVSMEVEAIRGGLEVAFSHEWPQEPGLARPAGREGGEWRLVPHQPQDRG